MGIDQPQTPEAIIVNQYILSQAPQSNQFRQLLVPTLGRADTVSWRVRQALWHLASGESLPDDIVPFSDPMRRHYFKRYAHALLPHIQ